MHRLIIAAACLTVAISCAISQSRTAGAAGSNQPATLTITLAGDTGLNPNHQTVTAKGVHDGGFQTWADTTALIAPEINGDLNFMNVETIVTNRNNLPRDRKGQKSPFSFRMHPNGLKHLVSRGFNVLSLANNHSMDYGVPGPKRDLETRRRT